MMNARSILQAAIVAVASLALGTGSAWAQAFPSKPVRIVVPFPPGGTVDVLARLIAPKMSEGLGQPVIVDNRGGAGGAIGTNVVAQADPDGHTLLLTPNGIAVAPAMFRKLPYDPAKDFAPVTQLVATMYIIVANPSLPASSMKEFIELAKAKPGSLNYGSNGVTDPLQLTMELLKLSTGIDVVPVPYKGVGPLNAAVLGGEVPLAVMPLSISVASVTSGRLRALGVTGPRRAAVLPDVPTVAESGVPGFEAVGWQGLFVPAKTPRSVVERLNQEAVKALNAPDVRERVIKAGQEPVGSTVQDFDARFRSDLATFARIVKEAGIPPQD
jgi:tripartite-type tricarboxylate transporter receptor subunit TctC